MLKPITPILVLLAIPAMARADDTSFATCPYYPAPLGNAPGNNTFNQIVTDTGPFAMRTWYFPNGNPPRHHVFVTTDDGLSVFNFDDPNFDRLDPTTQTQITTVKSGGVTTQDTVDGVKLLLVAEPANGIHSFLATETSTQSVGTTSSNASHLTKEGVSSPPCDPPNDNSGNPVKAGTIDVIATSVPGLAFATNECIPPDKSPHSGSIDVIQTELFPPTIVQRVRVDRAPVGLALGSNDGVLYVTVEKAGSVANTMAGHPNGTLDPNGHTGALLVFAVHPSPSDGKSFLTTTTAVNPGCVPSRVELDNQGRVWVSARQSNEVQVFSAALLTAANADHAKVARVTVGPEPGPMKLFDGGQGMAVGNTFRTNDLGQFPGYPRPTVMIFKTADLDVSHPGTPQHMPVCRAFGTPFGYGDFPRNFAADDQRLYVALYGADRIQWRDMSTLNPIIDSCP